MFWNITYVDTQSTTYVFCKHTHLRLTCSIAKQRHWKYKILVAALAKYNDYHTHLSINRFIAKHIIH